MRASANLHKDEEKLDLHHVSLTVAIKVHHHLYEIYLNLVGRILLKHLLILSAQLPKSSGLSFADLSFRPALTTKQSMHAARMWLEIGHFSCSLLPWCNLTCPRRFSHTAGLPVIQHINIFFCFWFPCNWPASAFGKLPVLGIQKCSSHA